MKALGRPVIVSLFRSMGVVGDGTPDLAQMVLTGVSAADSVVSLFDGRTLLGSTTAAASGIWRFTIGAFLDEIHSFTAVATNAAGEMSAASPAVRVTAVMNRIASIVPDAAAVGDSIANAGVLMLNGVARRLLTAKLCQRMIAGNATSQKRRRITVASYRWRHQYRRSAAASTRPDMITAQIIYVREGDQGIA